MAQKLYLKQLFGKRYVHISQDHNCTTSHNGTGASDCIIDHQLESPVYAPCSLQLVSMSTGSNTMVFRSTEQVQLTDGSVEYLLIGFAHMSDSKRASLGYSSTVQSNIGRLFSKGQIIYYTGLKGILNNGVQVTSPDYRHVHIRLGTGSMKSSTSPLTDHPSISGRYILNCTGEAAMTLDKGFFTDNMTITYSSSGGAYASSYSWITDDPLAEEYPSSGLGVRLVAKRQSFVVRQNPQSSTSPTYSVNVGGYATILKFLGIYSDGYQWCKVKYNNGGTTVIGYAQIDTYNCYTIEATTSFHLYLEATVLQYAMRTSAPNGSIFTTCTVGNKTAISSFQAIQSDDYQWCKVLYNGLLYWAQIDTNRCYKIVEEDE